MAAFRPLLPQQGYHHKNGIRWRVRKLFDSSISIDEDEPEYESALISAIRAHVVQDDFVGVIGGGRGISAAAAALKSGQQGEVIVYEGSSDRIEWIANTAKLNSVDSIVDVYHAIVGPDIDVYGNKDGAERIHPSNLPDFDVLEMDCEGAELKIIKEMSCRPRVIIVEVHPTNSPMDEVEHNLDKMGYDIVDRELENEETGNPLPVLTAKYRN